MKLLQAACLALFVPISLFAQTPQTPNAEAVRAESAAINSVQKYCQAVETNSQSQAPRLFAETRSAADQPARWIEFSTKADWQRAGKPTPLALTWQNEGKIVRVAIAFEERDKAESSSAVYCYQPDGKLARTASVPSLRTDCDDAYFHCQVTFGREWLYLPDGRKLQVLEEFDSRLIKSERTSYSLSKQIPPEYLTVGELPFASSLR